MIAMNNAKAVSPATRLPSNGATTKATKGKVQIQMIKANVISSEWKWDSLNILTPFRTVTQRKLLIGYLALKQLIWPFYLKL